MAAAMRRVRWTMEEYALIEQFTGLGLPPHRIARLMDPPVSAAAMRVAIRRAGLGWVFKPGKPRQVDQARWDRIEEQIMGGRGPLTRTQDAVFRERIAVFAGRLGYEVVITRRDDWQAPEGDHVDVGGVVSV